MTDRPDSRASPSYGRTYSRVGTACVAATVRVAFWMQFTHKTGSLMEPLTGRCYCGNIHLTMTLSIEAYGVHPRACDCDFCQRHGAEYVSDPRGSLHIRIKAEREVGRFRQGSDLAELLLCRTCGVLVGALYRDGDQLFGTVNARALDGHEEFGPSVTVSPKSLAPEEKTKRWQQVWFSDVRVETV
jgi:hypothetical protein